MITTSVTRAKSQLSALLKRVARGETVLILHRGRPVARLVPARDAEDDPMAARLDRLEEQGIVRRAGDSPDAAILDGDAPRISEESSLLVALLDERRTGR